MSNTSAFDKLTPDQEVLVDGILEKHAGKPGALMPILKDVQETIGYIPKQAQVMISERLQVSLSEIYGIITFYALFSLKPKGKYHISACKGTACYVRGATEIIEKLEAILGIKAGDTTDDGKFSLDVIRCLGACGLGPVIMVNNETYARLKPEDIPGIIARYANLGTRDYETIQKEKDVQRPLEVN